jgi:hypothetical protein
MGLDAAFRDLETLYADLERELSARAPVCRRSSRCCRFKEYGHQLWTTALELDWLLAERAAPVGATEAACPYLQADGSCGARGRRMLGCRIYFCDPAYQDAMNPLYERFHRRMKDLHRRHGIPYEYRELTAALRSRAGSQNVGRKDGIV